MNLHKGQLYLLEQNMESGKIVSINTPCKVVLVKISLMICLFKF